jgi:hypothetical protein
MNFKLFEEKQNPEVCIKIQTVPRNKHTPSKL